MVGVVLWLFDRVAFLIRAAGADYAQFRAILGAKLSLDNRRQSTALQSRRRSGRRTFVKSLCFYAFFGLFVGITPLFMNPMASLTLIFAFNMLMIAMSLIADFTGVLIDTTDLAVLSPRPVGGRTILVARLAHICTYLGLTGLSLSLATLVTGSIKYGVVFAAIYLPALACAIILIVFGVNLFYLVALRFFNAERFKDLITYFQIVMTVMVFMSYQVLPRLVDIKKLAEFEIAGRWWTYVTPPCWFAAPVALAAGQSGIEYWVLSIESALIPLVGLLLVVRYLAPGFSRRLARLGSDAAGAPATAEGGRVAVRELLGGLVARSRLQRVGFDFVWAMAARDRQFKASVWPQVAFIVIFPCFLLLIQEGGPAAAIAKLGSSKAYLFPLYALSWLQVLILLALPYSTQYEAAWFVVATPVDRPAELLLGAVKALACRLVLPVFCLMGVVLVGLAGPAVLTDVVLAGAMTAALTGLVLLTTGRDLPFSQPVSAAQSSGRVGRNFAVLVPAIAAGGLHYALSFVPYAPAIAIGPAIAAALLLTHLFARLPARKFGMPAG